MIPRESPMSGTILGWSLAGWLFGGHAREQETRRDIKDVVDRLPETRAENLDDRIDGIPSAELLSRIRAGNRDALGILYTALFQSLWSVAVVQVRSPDVAKDIVHDVMLRFWTRRDAIKPDLDIRVYLAVAVRNQARNVAKHGRVAEAAASAIERAERDVPGVGTPMPQPDDATEAHEFTEAYQRALGLLTERERVAALLRWEQGMTLEQVARVLEVSIEGARGIVARAQRKVQDALAVYRT